MKYKGIELKLGKTRFYERWENRWLKLAEQFKEDK